MQDDLTMNTAALSNEEDLERPADTAPSGLRPEIRAIRKAHLCLLLFILVVGVLIPFTNPVFHLIGAIFICLFMSGVVKKSKRNLFRSPPFASVAYAVLMELAALLLLLTIALFLTASLTSWLGPLKMARSLLDWQKSGGTRDALSLLQPGAATFFTVAVLVPFYEECFFRGYLLDVYRELGDRFAVIFSALLFCALHVPFFNSFFTFIVGIVFGIFTVRYNSILPSFLIHMLGNFLAASAQAFMPASGSSGGGKMRLADALQLSSSIKAAQPWLGLFSALLALLSLYLLYRLSKRLWRQKEAETSFYLTIGEASRVFFHWPVLCVMGFFILGLTGWLSTWSKVFFR